MGDIRCIADVHKLNILVFPSVEHLELYQGVEYCSRVPRSNIHSVHSLIVLQLAVLSDVRTVALSVSQAGNLSLQY